MGEIKEIYLSNHAFSKSSWAVPRASLFSKVENLTQLLSQLERLLGEKPRLVGQPSARWFTADRYLKIEGTHTLLELIFILLTF